MIKALLKNDSGEKIVIFGLSRLNTELLLQSKPISIDFKKEFGIDAPDLKVFIMGGETEESMENDLKRAFPFLVFDDKVH